MRRQLVPGPVVRLTVIKAKTRPGIEAILRRVLTMAISLQMAFNVLVLQDSIASRITNPFIQWDVIALLSIHVALQLWLAIIGNHQHARIT